MMGRPVRIRPGLALAAVWLAGFVVIGLVLARVASSPGSTTGPATVSSTLASSGDPVGQVQAIAESKRVLAATIGGRLIGGGSYDPAASVGHITVVTAWASWCQPCRKELPELRRLALASYASPVVFVGLDEEEASMANGVAMAQRYGLPYSSIFDPDKGIYLALAPAIAPDGVPGTVVIDSRGRVAATVIGAIDEAQLSRFLQALAAQRA